MPTAGFRRAVEPILHEVEAVEWTVDAGFGRPIPPSARAVLDAYGAAGRLYGHGLGYSALSAGRGDVGEAWLAALRADVADHRYRHLSEHLGFCTGGPWRFGPPLPMPCTAATVAVGRERLARLREAAGVPVGLENLALAFGAADVLGQGAFVDALLPEDGFVHLDLHNLWCGAVNFGLDPERVLGTWPLGRVRAVHVSGGTWADGIRRDTHDDRVPAEVWDLLRAAIPVLPACEVVLLERIGSAFASDADQEAFRADWRRLAEVAGG
jgi:uncharacterized protein (UPF0276 family)